MSNPWWDVRPTISNIADEQDRKIQFIWKQIIDPCDAPITVWIWLMWAPFKKLILQWYAVDVLQIYTAYLRPNFAPYRPRSRRHWGGGKKKKRPKGSRRRINPVAFDPNEFIGDTLMGFNELGGFRPYPGEMFIWTVEGVIERLLFYWMILDLGTDFLYEWTSAVAATKYCHARDDAVLRATSDGYPLLGIFGWDPMGPLDVVKMRHIIGFNGYAVTVPFGPGQMAAICQAQPVVGHVPDPWINIRLRCLLGTRQGLTVESGEIHSQSAEVTAAVQGICWTGETWIAEIKVNGLWNIIDPTLDIHCVFQG